MKAKVKETGKWIIVDPCNLGFYDVNTHDIYDPDELDFAAEFDWQSFRREAAKDILGAVIAKKSSMCSYGEVVEEAIKFADELIKQLQKK